MKDRELSPQCKALLDAFKQGRALTVLEAAQDPDLACFALSQRCGELRNWGFDIQSKWYKTANGARVMRYFLASHQLELTA